MQVSEIRAVLKARGLSQVRLAAVLGVSENHLSQMLSGKRRMSIETYRKIEAFLATAENQPRGRGVAEAGVTFTHGKPGPLLPCLTLEQAKALKSRTPVRMSEEDRALFYREIAELGAAGRRLPRVTDMTDDEILGYDEMP
jgi:transcriptional regulator with XRE-family HTH domain